MTINGKLAYCIVDTGASGTVLDVSMARALGLKLRMSAEGDCGTFTVPGSSTSHRYAAVVDEPVRVQFGPRAAFLLTGVRVVNHPVPLALLGADILRGGRGAHEWNFTGLTYETQETGEVTGYLGFRRGSYSEACPLAHSPTERGAGPPTLIMLAGAEAGYAEGPPLGDQCL